MRLVLDLPPVQTRQKVEQVKAYFSAVENPYIPLHEAMKDAKGCSLGRGTSWMGHTEGSILQARQLTEFEQTKEWEWYPDWFQHLCETLLPESLGRLCQKWPAGETDWEIVLFHPRKRQTTKISKCTVQIDGAVTKNRSGWGSAVKQGVTMIHEDSAVYTVSTSSFRQWQWEQPHSTGLPQELTVRPHMPSSSHTELASYKKWEVEWEAQTGTCQCSTSTFENSCGCSALAVPRWREMTAWKEEALSDFPWKDEGGLSSVRRTLELFQRHRWGCNLHGRLCIISLSSK